MIAYASTAILFVHLYTDKGDAGLLLSDAHRRMLDQSPTAMNIAVRDKGNSSFRDFCIVPDPITLTPADREWVDAHSLDLVNVWQPDRLAALEDAVECFWAEHRYPLPILGIGPINLCVHNPRIDTLISADILSNGWWGGVDEVLFMMAGILVVALEVHP